MRYSNDPSGLKRSLAAARAEIERLTKEMAHIIAERDKTFALMLGRAEKAEAERDEALAQVKAAFEYAAKLCDDTAQEALNESGTCSRILWTWFRGQSSAIRAITPSDAKAALETYGCEKVREGMQRAADIAAVKPRRGGRPLSGPHHAGIRRGRNEASRLILAEMEKME